MLVNQNIYIPLAHRAVIKISGNDAATFLQGLITNDIHKATEQNPLYALMLTPQGKYLYDFFIAKRDGEYFLDVSSTYKNDIIKRLSMYKLRSDVAISDISTQYECAILMGEALTKEIDNDEKGSIRPFCKGTAYIDPRNPQLGARAFIERENHYQSFEAKEFSAADISTYEEARISLAIADGDHDMISGESFPLDFGMDTLGAIDFKKGCYVGQEVTARVHHKSSPKKAIYRVRSVAGNLPQAGTAISYDGKKLGELRSAIEKNGLALLRKDDVKTIDAAKADNIDITILK